MSDQRTIVNGQVVESLEDSDPDLFAAFRDFRERMEEVEDSSGWMRVYRIPTDYAGNPVAGTKKRSELFNFPWGAMQPDDVVERVRREYMRPGEVRVTIQITGGRDSARGVLLNRLITIEKPNENDKTKPDTLSEVMRVMQQAQTASDDRMERVLAAMAVRNSSAEPFDPMKMMTMMMGMMTIGMNMGKQNQPAPAGIGADPVDGMMKMMGLMSSMKDFTAKLEGPKAEGASGDGDSLGNMLSSVAKIAEPISLMLKSAANNPKLPAPGARVIRKDLRLKENRQRPPSINDPPPLATAPAASTLPSENISPAQLSAEDENKMELEKLKANLGIVITMHDTGQTPESVAQLVLNSTPPDQQDELLDLMAGETFVADMAMLDPRINLDVEWYEALALAVCDLIDPDAAEGAPGATVE